MALGHNRKYNNLCGIPISSAQLTPSAPEIGTVAAYTTANIPVVVETAPKTATGLPTGDDAEQYIVDFGPNIWHLSVFANGAAISAGTRLTHLVTALTTAYAGNAKVGDLSNDDATVAGVTFAEFASANAPVLMSVLGTGTSIASAARGDCEVIFGL